MLSIIRRRGYSRNGSALWRSAEVTDSRQLKGPLSPINSITFPFLFYDCIGDKERSDPKGRQNTHIPESPNTSHSPQSKHPACSRCRDSVPRSSNEDADSVSAQRRKSHQDLLFCRTPNSGWSGTSWKRLSSQTNIRSSMRGYIY